MGNWEPTYWPALKVYGEVNCKTTVILIAQQHKQTNLLSIKTQDNMIVARRNTAGTFI